MRLKRTTTPTLLPCFIMQSFVCSTKHVSLASLFRRCRVVFLDEATKNFSYHLPVLPHLLDGHLQRHREHAHDGGGGDNIQVEVVRGMEQVRG